MLLCGTGFMSENLSCDNTETVDGFCIREVVESDLAALESLEISAFETDRLSRRRFRFWIRAQHRVFLVVTVSQQLAGYGLVILHKGTRLARLYSLAIAEGYRGHSLGRRLLEALEEQTSQQGRLYMRLEVADDNQPAIALYRSLGYHPFSWIEDYYDDHRNALRMQKRIRYLSENMLKHPVTWYRQTTEFTCGPASLMMAMNSIDSSYSMSQDEELDIWRQATTIFMTSGHGGCHPVGLALAAKARGFEVSVYLNRSTPLFIDGVRSAHKKQIMTMVDRQFRHKADALDIPVIEHEITQQDIAAWLSQGSSVIMLISTWRIDGRKAPHWVALTAIDDECLYLHDPSPADDSYNAFDCQYVPVARDDFDRMSNYGSDKLRTAVVLDKKT